MRLSIISGASCSERATQRAREDHGEELDDEQNDADSDDNLSHGLKFVRDDSVAVGL